MDNSSDPGGDYYSFLFDNNLLNNLEAPFIDYTFPQLVLLLQWINADVNWITIAPALGLILLLIAGSALVSGSEVAFFSLSPKQLTELRKENTMVGNRIVELLEQPSYLLATILITNNLFNIAMAIISNFVIQSIFTFDSWLVEMLITAVCVTFVLVLFGEVMPKVYATYNNLRLASITAIPLSIFNKIFKPASRLLVNSTSILERKMDALATKQVSIEEIDQAIDLVASTDNNQTRQQDIDMLKGLVAFGDIGVTQIMRSRLDMFALDSQLSYGELREQVIGEGFSRIPIYEDDLDKVVGILYVKDLLQNLEAGNNFNWQSLLKRPFFVPETKKIDDLLKEMQRRRVHLAIVVDEYGGTSGLITLEDILEEIVGDIRDEYDGEDEDFYFKKINTNNYVLGGRAMLHDVCKRMKLKTGVFDDVKGDSDSLAGLLLELAGNFPEKDEIIRYKRFQFTVLAKEGNRIDRVKISILPDAVMES